MGARATLALTTALFAAGDLDLIHVGEGRVHAIAIGAAERLIDAGFATGSSGDGLQLHSLGIDPSSPAASGVAPQSGKIVVQNGFLPPDDESVVYARFAMKTIFGDDFESQNLSVWSSVSPGS